MITIEQLESLWFTKKSNAELQSILGVSKNQLWGLKLRYRLPARDTRVVNHEPGEAEIEAACLEIQSGWTAEERERRRVGGASIPVLAVGSL